jgi:dephospho-CoA kinase
MSTGVPYVVGVTGGIGSGKSTVCEEFAALGAPVIDTDQVAREVVAPGTPGLAALVAAFGQDILNDQGELDRRRMRQQVFANPALRQQLEAILHPLIRTGTQEKIDAAGYPYCLVCIPLLVERGGVNRVDRVLVIDVPEAVQIARVIARDELTASEAAAIMQSQASREQRAAVANDVLENSGPLSALRPQIAALHARYLQLAQAAKKF